MRGKGPTIHMTLEDYLDSQELFTWMSRYSEEVLDLVHVHRSLQGPLLPVFVWDQGSAALPVLLDGDRQAVAYPGMVLAVHTHDHQVETEFSCDGQELFQDDATLTRAVLAASLQAGGRPRPAAPISAPAKQLLCLLMSPSGCTLQQHGGASYAPGICHLQEPCSSCPPLTSSGGQEHALWAVTGAQTQVNQPVNTAGQPCVPTPLRPLHQPLLSRRRAVLHLLL